MYICTYVHASIYIKTILVVLRHIYVAQHVVFCSDVLYNVRNLPCVTIMMYRYVVKMKNYIN